MGNGYGKSKRGNGHSTWTWTKHYPKRLPPLSPPLFLGLFLGSNSTWYVHKVKLFMASYTWYSISSTIHTPRRGQKPFWPHLNVSFLVSFFSPLFLCVFSSVFRFLCDDLWICMNCADEVLCKVHAAIEFIWFGIYCCCPSFVLHCRYTFWRLPPRCASLNWVRAGWSSNSEEFCELDEDVWLVCAAEVEGNTIYSCRYI